MTTVGSITLDGSFSDWTAANSVATPGNTVPGYDIFGALVNDPATAAKYFVIGINGAAGGVPFANFTNIYLNTDQSTATGYNLSWAPNAVGAEYFVQLNNTSGTMQAYLYATSSSGTATLLNGGAPIPLGISSDGKGLEIAISQALLTPAGGTAPQVVGFDVLNGGTGLPTAFANQPQYTITDPASLAAVDHSVKKIAIVWSDTTFKNYFSLPGVANSDAQKTAYADLFMAVQHQAQAAGVSFDVLTEADLTNVAKMAQYSAIVFPNMEYVQASQATAIQSALHHVVYDYHVPIITSGNFMTTTEAGVSLGYGAMQDLLNLTHNPAANGFGSGQYYVTPDATALANHNQVVSGYASGQHIGGASGLFATDTPGYYNTGWDSYVGFTSAAAATTVANINLGGPATVNPAQLAGVVETTTGGTNVHFATAGIMADSNILQHAMQAAVFGNGPALTLDMTRSAGLVAARIDMDQSQFRSDVSPVDANNNPVPGIYDSLIPILQSWKSQYNFVGSFFINVGDQPNAADPQTTNWAVSNAYYKAILAMGSEIGSHSMTHLINPPPGGAPILDANGNVLIANGNTENTNTLTTSGGLNGNPNWTFAYEFGQSNAAINTGIGITVAGAAVPGMPETIATSQNILPYYLSANGLTGYVSGGWTGVGSGYPNAFGYMTPANMPGANGAGGSIYLAPNMTFDFTELEFQKKPLQQALQDWITQFQELSSNSATPTLIWPFHDYGATAWSFDGTPSPYSTAMFTAFIAYASGYDVTFDASGNPVISSAPVRPGYEFVTAEDLASRIAAQQRVVIKETPSATDPNVISVSVTPGVVGDDLGKMALNVTNGSAAAPVIHDTGSGTAGWYAYNSTSLFVAKTGIGSAAAPVVVTLGATQADVTHVDALPMRADLLSVSGDGSSVQFAIAGDGAVGVHVKTPGANVISIQGAPVVNGAPVATLTGNELSLLFNDGPLALSALLPTGAPITHTVAVSVTVAAVASLGADIFFGGTANDIFSASGGNDVINGGTGANRVVFSGLATDYSFTQNADGSIKVVDLRAGSPDGTDLDINIQTFQFSNGQVLTAAQLPYPVWTGTAGNDVWTGSPVVNAGQSAYGLAGNDTLTAGTGGKTYIDGGDGADRLADAAAAAATIVDTLVGGAGNDTYVISRASTIVVEQADPALGGIDTVRTSLASYTLADGVENLILTGTSQAVVGNALDNTISGFRGTTSIDGGVGANDKAVFTGQFASYAVAVDALAGTVTLTDGRNNSPDGSATFKNVELFQFSDGLVLTAAQLGAGTTVSTSINGTASADLMTVDNPLYSAALAAAGAIVSGLGGNDTMTAGAANQVIDGGTGADLLSDGGQSGITMLGGGGNDTFIVTNASTVITEPAGSGGNTVQTSVAGYALPANVTNLVWIGSGGVSWAATLVNESLTGGTSADALSDGGLAGITLRGGGGADVFTVTNSGTRVVETAGTVGATIETTLASYSLGGNVSNLTYTGSGSFNGSGNGQSNTVTGGSGADQLNGNGGADRLIGGAGSDRLSGGGGGDTFVFSPVNKTLNNAGFGQDVITDFRAGGNANHDVLELSKALFALTAAQQGMTDAQLGQALVAGQLKNADGGTVTVTGGGNAVITIDANDTITLNGVNANTLKLASNAAVDFHFV